MQMPSPTRIVVVDDEPAIRELLMASLKFSGFEAHQAASGDAALKLISEVKPNLIVLDVMMPGSDGFTVARTLRAQGVNTPIIFLTAKDNTADKVRGLTVGGDDYLTKPFSIEELVARINAILRRSTTVLNVMPDDDEHLQVGDLELDKTTFEVNRSGVSIELSPTELKLLEYLMENAGRVVSKEQILNNVWNYGFNGEANIVESYISYLRRKIDNVIPPGSKSPLPAMIHTKRGLGYQLKPAPTSTNE